MILYAATTNAGKLREFAESASAESIEVHALPGLADMPEPVEDAATFMGNAERKALAYSRRAPGLMVFADDSGLEVEALGSDPGVRSARFADDLNFEAGSGLARDERNNRCLLSLLQQREDAATVSRRARFVCALVLAQHGAIRLRAEGEVHGDILKSPRGANGFGYDPLFLLPHLGKTMAELPRDEKWAVGHRGLAFRSLLSQLRAQAL